MGNHSDQPLDVDPQALRDARVGWDFFTKAMTMGVVSVIGILVLMAIFLV